MRRSLHCPQAGGSWGGGGLSTSIYLAPWAPSMGHTPCACLHGRVSWDPRVEGRLGEAGTLLRICTLSQSCCSRLRKVLEPYKPEWCRSREPWSLYLFSPQNR